MAALVTAVDVEFTPAAGDFIAEVTGAAANLLRKNNAASVTFAIAAELNAGDAVIVANPVAGAVYKFTGLGAGTTPTVRADQ